MGLLSLFVPTLTNGIVGGLLIALGIAIIVLTLIFAPILIQPAFLIGSIIAGIGLIVIFAFSWIDKILADPNLIIALVGIVGLIHSGIYLFSPKKKRR